MLTFATSGEVTRILNEKLLFLSFLKINISPPLFFHLAHTGVFEPNFAYQVY